MPVIRGQSILRHERSGMMAFETPMPVHCSLSVSGTIRHVRHTAT